MEQHGTTEGLIGYVLQTTVSAKRFATERTAQLPSPFQVTSYLSRHTAAHHKGSEKREESILCQLSCAKNVVDAGYRATCVKSS